MRATKIPPKLSSTLLLALLLLGGLCAARAQSAPPRQEVEATIRAQARQDASQERQRDPGHVIEMFRDAAAAAGVAPNEIVNVYEKEYAEARAAEPWWKGVSPQWGWLAAGVMLLLLVFRDVLTEALKSAVTNLKEGVYKRISGYRLFRRTALRHYREALVRRYQLLKIPFRPDQPLNVRDIYVPLKVKGAADAEQVDAFKTMAVTRRMMVVGPPGSGKSMLLKHVALSYADGKFTHLPDRPIPILLELNRLNDSPKTVEEHLVDSLDINDFPNARNFVDLGLEGGTLMLLFDGLDEVNSSRREQVVKAISDLLLKHPSCRAIITCRTAVYRNEFTEVTDQTLEIVEFTDQQVQSFLSAWHPYMPAGKSIEQLVNTLQARPRIMALARNPLLLTIIAFLYTDTEFVLPDSRTEFYDQAIDVLLRQWKYEANRFKAPHKRIVLQHLALFNQESDAARGQDRRSIDLQTVIEEIKKVLPALNLELKEADPLLDEIVERSGLLLPIDGGSKYQFAHLTLQEFFAATALGADEQGLLKRFLSDPDAWRETVKLWCGLEQDSTALVTSIFAHDPITAFECLADAQKISPALAEKIIDHFKGRLETDSEVDEKVVRAFSAVASGQSPRSQAVFGYLADKLKLLSGRPASAESLRAGIVNAMALTNKPAAVTELLQYFDRWPEVRAAVVKMGDLAVKGLSELDSEGHDPTIGSTKRHYAIKGLSDIGTPKAAAALVPMLWRGPGEERTRAARGLSSLFRQPLVLDSLRHYPLENWQKAPAEFWFVWAPFNEDAGTSLPTIAGKCAQLLEERPASVWSRAGYYTSEGADDMDLSMGSADLRLVVPTILRQAEFHELKPIRTRGINHSFEMALRESEPEAEAFLSQGEWMRDYSRYYRDGIRSGRIPPSAPPVEYVPAYVQDVFARLSYSRVYALLAMLSPFHQFRALTYLFSSPRPTLKDWPRITQRDDYDFKDSWQYKASQALVAFFCLVALCGAGVYVYQARSTWAAVAGVSLLVSVGVATYVHIDDDSVESFTIIICGTVTIPYLVFKDIYGSFVLRKGRVTRSLLAVSLPIFLFPALSLFFAFDGVSRFAGRTGAFISLAALPVLVLALFIWGKLRERKANPLLGLLDDKADTFSDFMREWYSPADATQFRDPAHRVATVPRI